MYFDHGIVFLLRLHQSSFLLVCLSVCYQSCDHDILQNNKPILLQIGAGDLWGKGMKRLISGVRKSKIKVTGGCS